MARAGPVSAHPASQHSLSEVRRMPEVTGKENATTQILSISAQ